MPLAKRWSAVLAFILACQLQGAQHSTAAAYLGLAGLACADTIFNSSRSMYTSAAAAAAMSAAAASMSLAEPVHPSPIVIYTVRKQMCCPGNMAVYCNSWPGVLVAGEPCAYADNMQYFAGA